MKSAADSSVGEGESLLSWLGTCASPAGAVRDHLLVSSTEFPQSTYG